MRIKYIFFFLALMQTSATKIQSNLLIHIAENEHFIIGIQSTNYVRHFFLYKLNFFNSSLFSTKLSTIYHRIIHKNIRFLFAFNTLLLTEAENITWDILIKELLKLLFYPFPSVYPDRSASYYLSSWRWTFWLIFHFIYHEVNSF